VRARRVRSAACGIAQSTINGIESCAARVELGVAGIATVSVTACANRARKLQRLSMNLQFLFLAMMMIINKRFI